MLHMKHGIYWWKHMKKHTTPVDEQPDITLAEIVEKLNLPVGIETVRRRLQAMGYRRKKKLSSIRLDGRLSFTTFQGGTTGDKFLAYLKDVLIPTLRPGDIVVMDNLRTHHIQAVSDLLHDAGAQVLYLPAYSPDLNPIEKLWSKVKAVLRKLRIRSLDALDAAIRFALDQVSADDCAGWFSCAGYCLF